MTQRQEMLALMLRIARRKMKLSEKRGIFAHREAVTAVGYAEKEFQLSKIKQ
jgi:hypothetical protein